MFYVGVLFLIEGAGQSGLALNWGDGIAADRAIIQSYGISDTNPFFTALLKKPYLNQVVAAPHVYPPSISKATTSTTVVISAHEAEQCIVLFIAYAMLGCNPPVLQHTKTALGLQIKGL